MSWAQSGEVFVGLRRLGRTRTLLVGRGEGHGGSGWWEPNRREALARIPGWRRRYLAMDWGVGDARHPPSGDGRRLRGYRARDGAEGGVSSLSAVPRRTPTAGRRGHPAGQRSPFQHPSQNIHSYRKLAWKADSARLRSDGPIASPARSTSSQTNRAVSR